MFILVFSLARSNSLFLICFSSSVFLFLLFDGQWWGLFLLCCYCLFSTTVSSVSLNIPDQVTAVAALHQHRGGRGGASSLCSRVIDTSQTRPLALIGCVEAEVVDSDKSNYSNWVEPQTADLYLILLSDRQFWQI